MTCPHVDPGASRRWLKPSKPLGARDRYRVWLEVKWLRRRNYPQVRESGSTITLIAAPEVTP